MTLSLYILRELLKIGVSATAVLIAAISFAAAIRPLSDGLLGPGTLLRFVGFTAPTMLGFVLPFAGAFASTLVFHRLAADNEVLACAAGGLSYRRILRPVFLLGLTCTVLLFFLSSTVIPRYYQQAERVITADMVTVMVSQLNQNKPFELNNRVLYADSAASYDTADFPGEAEALRARGITKFVELRGVAVGLMNRDDMIREDTTAESAQLVVARRPDSDDNYFHIRVQNGVRFDPERRTYVRVDDFPYGPFFLPDQLGDDVRFYSAADLRELAETPLRYDRVREATDAVRLSLATEKLRRLLAAGMADAVPGETGSGVRLNGPIGTSRYLIRASAIDRAGDVLLLRGAAGDADDGRVVIERYADATPGAAPTEIYQARSASLEVSESLLVGDTLEVNVLLEGVRVVGEDVRQAEIPIKGLIWPDPIFAEGPIRALPFEAIRELVRTPPFANQRDVQRARNRLVDELTRLARTIRAHTHERAASAVSCTLLILLGAVLAIALRGRPPLVTFFWAFLLAMLTIILISTGRTLGSSLKFPLAAGLGIMWAGNAVLLAVLGVVYCRVARH